ncbi:MAG: hypothetical protein R3213_07560 [Flavobacteriaceae bacterium]|nr:hypothetical protein [Flavobacteriaceae bacterium]
MDKIEKLLEKYEDGETSIAEERLLKNFFAKDNVPQHLISYKPIFNYFSETKSEQYEPKVSFTHKRKFSYGWISIAAGLVIMLGLYFGQTSTNSQQEKEEALMAYNQTMEALNMVAVNLNQGKEVLNPLNVLNTNLNEGMQKANLINEFSETTNIVYNTSNN